MSDASAPNWDRGYVHVYTGDGKGKTTAAFGLALRAVGAGLNVFIGQFVKSMSYSEVKAIGRLADCIELRQFGRGCLLHRKPEAADVDAARRGLEEVLKVFSAGRHRVVILDEANIATHLELITVDELLALIDARPDDVELILTGRRADPRVLERADLVTEMREVKHYYKDGVTAREGIER
jgi:cob(I)alamin adenosyltransferase